MSILDSHFLQYLGMGNVLFRMLMPFDRDYIFFYKYTIITFNAFYDTITKFIKQ